jgi:hypothetical protein
VLVVERKAGWTLAAVVILVSLTTLSLAAPSSSKDKDHAEAMSVGETTDVCQVYVSGPSTLLLAISERIHKLGTEITYTESLNPELATRASAVLLDDKWIQENESDIREDVDALALEGKLVIVVGDLSKYAFDGLVDKLSVDPRKDVIRSYDKQIVGRDPNICFAVNAIKVPTKEQATKGQAIGSMSLAGPVTSCRIEDLAQYVSNLIHNYAIAP